MTNEELSGRFIKCRGCPTVECTCSTELESDLLDKLSELIKACGGGTLSQALDRVKSMADEVLAARALRDKMMVEAGLDLHDSTIIQGCLLAPLLKQYDAIRAKNEGEK